MRKVLARSRACGSQRFNTELRGPFCPAAARLADSGPTISRWLRFRSPCSPEAQTISRRNEVPRPLARAERWSRDPHRHRRSRTNRRTALAQRRHPPCALWTCPNPKLCRYDRPREQFSAALLRRYALGASGVFAIAAWGRLRAEMAQQDRPRHPGFRPPGPGIEPSRRLPGALGDFLERWRAWRIAGPPASEPDRRTPSRPRAVSWYSLDRFRNAGMGDDARPVCRYPCRTPPSHFTMSRWRQRLMIRGRTAGSARPIGHGPLALPELDRHSSTLRRIGRKIPARGVRPSWVSAQARRGGTRMLMFGRRTGPRQAVCPCPAARNGPRARIGRGARQRGTAGKASLTGHWRYRAEVVPHSDTFMSSSQRTGPAGHSPVVRGMTLAGRSGPRKQSIDSGGASIVACRLIHACHAAARKRWKG